MRILMVVQRYGREVAGGAEQLCRMYGPRLAARGHDVHVLTTCARSYVDWANFYPPGTEVMDGVTVTRLPVRRARDHDVFGVLQHRVMAGRKPVPWFLQQEWMRQQGPEVDGLAPWLEENVSSYDLAEFFTYLYYTTWAGLPVAARRVPTILHPNAHDEPPILLPLFDPVFRHARALGLLTVEELDLIRHRFRIRRPCSVLGVGVDLEPPGDEAAFRASLPGLGERPYLLYVGRVDPHKGSDELFDQFSAYQQRRRSPLALVFLGEPVKPVPAHPDVFVTGFVTDEVRWSALRGCLALAVPSYFESFSMVLTEAWSVSKPALVQGHCAVLDGQARRSGGAIPYRGYAELEAALDRLLADDAVAGELGQAGRRYVEGTYRWEDVLDRYERLLERTAAGG
jgi:glycosyltransferase involved in cell wall biosynthesis